MKFWTASYGYPGPYRLDITVKGQDPIGRIFAPTWGMVLEWKASDKGPEAQQKYIAEYHKLMLAVFGSQEWKELLSRDYVVLVCFCPAEAFCHRHLLAYYLKHYGATYCGEIVDFGKQKDILEFKGDHAWLSNFAPCKFTHLDVEYTSTEAFYQAWKFDAVAVIQIKDEDNDIVWVNAREYVAKQPANIAKRLGKKADLCWNWDTIRVEVMKVALEYKFIHNLHYRALLKATGTAKLVEGNWWHDNFWGDCGCAKCIGIPGANTLGKLIMELRGGL